MLILNRMLKIDDEGHQTEVPVRIHLPVNAGDYWQSEYEIGWPECTRRSTAFDVDSIQSLLIALEKVGAEIYTSEVHKSGKLPWLDPGGGYGFPLPPGIRDLYQGKDQLFVIDAFLGYASFALGTLVSAASLWPDQGNRASGAHWRRCPLARL